MKAYIEEFASLAAINASALPIGAEPSVTTQAVTATTSTQSAAFNDATRFVRIHVDGICSYLFGADPTATVNTPRMVAGQTEYFAVVPGQKVAFVDNT